MEKDQQLHSNDALTVLVKKQGITTWLQLRNFVQQLPYGRNANRYDLSLVISEGKGTCSSKHALLKYLADQNEVPDISLVLGMYRMNAVNTPKIGTVLSDNALGYVPEAHCYLNVAGKRLDLTSANAAIHKIEKDILQEIVIQPEQVSDYKVAYHKQFVRDWLQDNVIPFCFEEIWMIREQCIENLSN